MLASARNDQGPCLASIVQLAQHRIQPSLTIAISTVARKMIAEGKNVISLSQGEPDFDTPQFIKDAAIAAIQGGCIGGAVDMVTACCIRYATQDAFFCVQEINIGLVADVGTLQRLPKLLPMGLVKELAYTGRRLSAENALKHGLVTQVFETQEALVAGALACAKEMANKPPVAIWGTKQALNYARDHSVEDSLRQMGWLQGAIWSNPHIREAIAAAKEKRPAKFPPLAPLKGFKTLG